MRQLQRALGNLTVMAELRAAMPVYLVAHMTDLQVVRESALRVTRGQALLTDVPGFTSISFDGTDEEITVTAPNGATSTFDASNNPVRKLTIGKLVNGSYDFEDTDAPHHHGKAEDSHNGPYGPGGIFRLKPFLGADNIQHSGVGLHAGRADKTDKAGREGFEYATEGCVRTTEDGIAYITNLVLKYPLTALEVVNNRDKS